MLLALPRRQHRLGARGRGPGKRPRAGRHDDDLVDIELDLELHRREYPGVRLPERRYPGARRKVRRQDDAVGRVQGHGALDVAALYCNDGCQ